MFDKKNMKIDIVRTFTCDHVQYAVMMMMNGNTTIQFKQVSSSQYFWKANIWFAS